ncbi:MAG TPA: HAD-IIIC family phosphatase [Puia sp.]|jgi:FkbH-like protein|nr:HAD-IIIC family phosphatase [Puia sp.]
MLTFNDIKKNIKKDYSGFTRIRLALMGDSATQLFRMALRGWAFEIRVDLEIFEADYGQTDRLIFDATSELYRFDPEYIVIFQTTAKLKRHFYALPKTGARGFAQDHLDHLKEACSALQSRLASKIIYLNFNELDDREFGNYATKTASSFLYQLRKINFELMAFSQDNPGFFLCDLSYLVGQAGMGEAVDDKFRISADMAFTPDFFVILAKNILDIVKAATGRFIKCVILDLDNTLWGGVIGDDGLEKIEIGDYKLGKAYWELQQLAKQLKERGILLAICSKNSEAVAKEPFERHPEMVLRMEDIVVFVANWENKADNIRYIREVLDISFDSMVFLDDNPFERELVRQQIPEITIPDLPDDPARYLSFLRGENLFETATFSEADLNRTVLYQVDADRRKYKMSVTDEKEFLKGLEMECEVGPFNPWTLPRVAQLIQRSNQFNLRTIRHTEDALEKMLRSDRHHTLSFTLRDRFGDQGLISAVILEERDGRLFIDTWVMSCRVLKRGVEQFVLREIAGIAMENGFGVISGEYLPTSKNGLVKDLLWDLGFGQDAGGWRIRVEDVNRDDLFIKKLYTISGHHRY